MVEKKELTAKDLREAFGNKYSAINYLLEGREDDYVFAEDDLLCRSDYVATKMWNDEDIRSVLTDMGYTGTDKQIDDVLNIMYRYIDILQDCTDNEWDAIYHACADAGYDGCVDDDSDNESDGI